MSASSKLSLIESLALLPASERQAELDSLTEEQAESIYYDWRWNARPTQLLPGTPGAASGRSGWRFWVPLAGRGWGKTRVGAETVREWAENPTERILLVGATSADVRDTMIEGPSGLLSCYPINSRPLYEPTRHRITFPSGAIGITRSADEPERLRGPQFRKFWFDELCACRFAQKAWDQLMFGFRQPDAALQGIITTTPKPIDVLKRILANPRAVITRGSSDENLSNLSPAYIADVLDPYRGTRLGRQEIEAELLEDVPGALWTRQLIDATRLKDMAEVVWHLVMRIVVAIDPAVSHNEDSDETGIVIAGLTRSGHVIVIDDLSCRETPLGWAKVAIAAFRSRRADMIVGEVNNGGDLVGANIRGVDPNVPFRAVRASRGKYLRAEPVSALYEQGRVHHVGFFPDLEDQMCSWTPQGNAKSPDRLDALVWAVTELLIDQEQVEGQFTVGQPVSISRF